MENQKKILEEIAQILGGKVKNYGRRDGVLVEIPLEEEYLPGPEGSKQSVGGVTCQRDHSQKEANKA